MATSSADLDSDMKECPICLDDMLNKEPKLLDCKHSFCKQCLTDLKMNREQQQLTLSCPICNHVTRPPGGSVDRLPDNFLLLEMKYIMDKASKRQHGIYCFYCSKKNETSTAFSFCLECERYLCKSCLLKHNTNKRLSGHTVKLLTQENEGEVCQMHGEQILYVCTECSDDKKFCDVCLMDSDICHAQSILTIHEHAREDAEENLALLLADEITVTQKIELTGSKIEQEEACINNHLRSVVQALQESSDDMINKIREASNIEAMQKAADKISNICKETKETLSTEKMSLSSIKLTTRHLGEAFACFSVEENKVKSLSFAPATMPSLGVLGSVETESTDKCTLDGGILPAKTELQNSCLTEESVGKVQTIPGKRKFSEETNTPAKANYVDNVPVGNKLFHYANQSK